MSVTSQLAGKITQHLELPEGYEGYYQTIIGDLSRGLSVAEQARRLGLDPRMEVEAKVTFDLAERVEALVGLPVADRLRELLARHRTELAALMLAEEVALGKFGRLELEAALDQAVRVGLAVVTDGVTVAPIQGVSEVRVKSNADGTRYAAVLFAGPIRSAGGTEAAFTLVLADHVRRTLGLDKYQANSFGDDEVGRFIEELRIYEREVGNFQFRVLDEDVRWTILHLPVEVDGVETDPVEVAVHRGLRRIGTDRVRGGALRVLNDGVIGRSRKLLKLVRDLSISGWEWLAELKGGQQQSSEETRAALSHFEEVISGRPVLSTPGTLGGFRLRYGRCFNTGLAAVGVHPAVVRLLDYAVVVGTQVKMDLPGKAATVQLVDTIEPPIVKLEDGSVVRVAGVSEAERLAGRVHRILHLGDLLISFGDFLENNVALPPSGYVEEWWVQDLAAALEARSISVAALEEELGLPGGRVKSFLREPLRQVPTSREAFKLSEHLGVPLHPRYLYFWDQLPPGEVLFLRSRMESYSLEDSAKAGFPLEERVKRLLERLGVPHQVSGNYILVEGDDAYALIRTLNPGVERPATGWTSTLELLQALSGVVLRRKSSAYVGIRVGRPEKAMMRRMKPPVHVLFPVGVEGGPTRDILQAAEKGQIKVELLDLQCAECGAHTPTSKCVVCGGETRLVRHCPVCGGVVEGELCPRCRVESVAYGQVTIPLKELMARAVEKVGYKPPKLLKGVQGLTNESRVPEPLEKGLLRRKHKLSVYKDGTIRFDSTNAPLTAFRPKDMGVSVAKLRELGYTVDLEGRPLEREDQLVELRVQDVIIPRNAAEHLLAVARFIDEELERLYGQQPFYRLKSIEDLLGQLVVGLAPHTSVGVIGRVVGFTSAQVCFAHPLWHSAKRRDCDGDGDSLMLLMDVLLNFSREFLPAQIGGLMDSPLLLQPIVIPHEVQRQAHNLDVVARYPREFYEATANNPPPDQVAELVETVRRRLKTPRQFKDYLFTHPTVTVHAKQARSIYSTLKTLPEKLEKQIELAEMIMAVDPREVVESVLRTHLLPDIVGNLKAYTSQSFRCKRCGTTHRRLPLKGVCLKCGGTLQPTVSRRSVEKYLDLGLRLAERYGVDPYLRTRLHLVSEELAVLFGPREGTQTQLTDYLTAGS
jgi:DNA polymerase II large subunit